MSETFTHLCSGMIRGVTNFCCLFVFAECKPKRVSAKRALSRGYKGTAEDMDDDSDEDPAFEPSKEAERDAVDDDDDDDDEVNDDKEDQSDDNAVENLAANETKPDTGTRKAVSLKISRYRLNSELLVTSAEITTHDKSLAN